MGKREYEQLPKYALPTPEGERLGWKLLRWSGVCTAAVLIACGLVLALYY